MAKRRGRKSGARKASCVRRKRAGGYTKAGARYVCHVKGAKRPRRLRKR